MSAEKHDEQIRAETIDEAIEKIKTLDSYGIYGGDVLYGLTLAINILEKLKEEQK